MNSQMETQQAGRDDARRERSKKRKRLYEEPLKPGTAAVIMKDIEAAVNAEYPMPLSCFAHVDEDNVRQVDFVLRETDKDLGQDEKYDVFYYHLRAIFPSDYPFNGPDWMVIVENGCMVGRICVLEFSRFHPEEANPTINLQSFFAAVTTVQKDFKSAGFRPYSPLYVRKKQEAFLTELEKNVAPFTEFKGRKSRRIDPQPVMVESVEYCMPSDTEDEQST